MGNASVSTANPGLGALAAGVGIAVTALAGGYSTFDGSAASMRSGAAPSAAPKGLGANLQGGAGATGVNSGGVGSKVAAGGGAEKTLGKVVQIGIQAAKDFFRNKPGRFLRTGSRAAMRELVSAIESGEDVMADSPSIAKDLARRAGGGREPTLHKVESGAAEQGFLPHYHPYASKSHVFFEPRGGFGLKDVLDLLLPGPTLITPMEQLLPNPYTPQVASPVR